MEKQASNTEESKKEMIKTSSAFNIEFIKTAETLGCSGNEAIALLNNIINERETNVNV